MRRSEKIILSLRDKTAILVFLVIALMSAVPLALWMFFGAELTRREIYKRYETITSMLAAEINKTIDDELGDLEMIMRDPVIVKKAEEANAAYSGMKEEDLSGYFSARDKEWSEKKTTDASLSGILDNPVSKGLKFWMETRGSIREIFVTDRYGGLVAASGRTSDFYQADEYWWQAAYGGGKGGRYAGDVEYDESSRSRAVPIASSIKDSSGAVIGVCKNVISLNKVMEPLSGFRYGKTGFAYLIDEKGDILFSPKLSSREKKIISGDCLKKMYFKDTGTMAMMGKNDIKVLALVRNPVMEKKGINWIVVFEQDLSEIYAPLNGYFKTAILVMVLLTVISVLISLYTGGVLSSPIESISLAVGKIAGGELDQVVKVDTGDELEALGDAVNGMAVSLKRSRDALLGYNARLESEVKARTAELEELKSKLESEVEERTREIVEKNEELLLDQKAMLLMVEDLNKQANELREAYDRIGKTERLAALGEISGMLGHELRNPLSTISNSAYYLRMKKDAFASDKTILRHMEIIEAEASRSNTIITNILSFARKKEPVLKRVAVHDILKELIVSKAFPVPDGIAIELDAAGLSREILGDAGQLKQVFTNIFTNAIEAMPKGGRISATGSEEGGYFTVTVKDEGVGIHEEHIDKIFQPLFTAKPKGTGLGLSVTAKIMEVHKGSIKVESKRGEGTKMILKFPIPDPGGKDG